MMPGQRRWHPSRRPRGRGGLLLSQFSVSMYGTYCVPVESSQSTGHRYAPRGRLHVTGPRHVHRDLFPRGGSCFRRTLSSTGRERMGPPEPRKGGRGREGLPEGGVRRRDRPRWTTECSRPEDTDKGTKATALREWSLLPRAGRGQARSVPPSAGDRALASL